MTLYKRWLILGQGCPAQGVPPGRGGRLADIWDLGSDPENFSDLSRMGVFRPSFGRLSMLPQ